MDNLTSRFREEFSKNKMAFFCAQFILSLVSVALLFWNIATLLKEFALRDIPFDFNAWTYLFFHPHESQLINYVFLASGLGIYLLLVYIWGSRKNIEKLRQDIEKIHYGWLVSLPFISLLMLILCNLFSLKFRLAGAFVIALLPVAYLLQDQMKLGIPVLWVTLFIGFTLLIYEPLNVVLGKIYLMNEYEDLFSETVLRSKPVKNKVILDNLPSLPPEFLEKIYLFYLENNLMKKQAEEFLRKERKEDTDVFIYKFFETFRYRNINYITEYMNLLNSKSSPSFDGTEEKDESGVPPRQRTEERIDFDSIKIFYLSNFLEYSHQNMSRGPMNHIGQILNPIHAFQSGKELREISFQYGLGNTFLFKWIMDIFGGVSIDKYYKCYLLYAIYYLTFFIMLSYIFHKPLYIGGSLLCLILSHFMWGYMAFILAPGVIPSIHLLDAIAVIILFAYFKKNHPFLLVPLAIISLGSIFINRQFGMILTIALFITLLFYFIENKKRPGQYLWLLILASIFGAYIFLSKFAITSLSQKGLSLFILGYFSWPSENIVIALTIIYFSLSYFVILLLKNSRIPYKYLYVFIFMYVQGLFIYYYWSGLTNHFPIVIPFVGVQIFLSFLLGREYFFKESPGSKKLMGVMFIVIILILMTSTLSAGAKYYKEKYTFRKNFSDHRVYDWDFERAKALSTIDPQPIAESISLIQKYSPAAHPGIFLISKYDNLLPFLANRYSEMPYFEMAWNLLTPGETRNAVQKIRDQRPRYIFVDSNLDGFKLDPWQKLFNGDFNKKERASRIGRYTELYKIFHEISAEYEQIESGKMISVYRRKEA